MKRTITAAILLCVCLLTLNAEDRNVAQKLFNAIPDKASVFKTGGDWMPFPEYSDREGWEKMAGPYKDFIIKQGEKALKYKWAPITASEFLDCQKDGDRVHLKQDREMKAAIATLTIAELVEGKGRFLPHLIDGMFYEAERATWQYAVHTNKQPSKKPLPDPADRYITNGAAHTCEIMTIGWYFFHKEFDKIDPTISKVILNGINRNILEPYLDDSKNEVLSHFWMGMDRNWNKTDGNVRNWTTHCNCPIMLAFLLCEQDQDRMLKALKKGMKLMDNYLESVAMDGSCDEGPSYWDMAGGKVYEFAKMMYDASNGKFNLLADDQVRRIGEYKAKIFIGDGWEVNFADGEPRSGVDRQMAFRIGYDTGCKAMSDYAIYVLANNSHTRADELTPGSLGLSHPFRALYGMKYQSLLDQAHKEALAAAGGDKEKMLKNLSKAFTSEWYPDGDVAIIRNDKGWFLSAKGGNNGESHNHNDVGSFMLFLDECPVFCDLGCGTYRKETFGSARWTLLENISTGHNTATVNGFEQGLGKEFTAKNSSCSIEKGTFSTDIALAYPAEAGCKEWRRTYKLTENGASITDSYSLTKRVGATDSHFLTNGKVTKCADGSVDIECRNFNGDRTVNVHMTCPKGMTLTVEDIPLNDIRHSKNYGPTIHRLVFTASDKTPLKTSFTFNITRK